MATRRDVREAFYDDLETAASGLVDPSNIGEEQPDTEEDLPSIVHADAYRKVPFNRNGVGPSNATRDSNGVITQQEHTVVMEARFVTTVVSDDEGEKEDIYEAVRTHFEEYTLPLKDESSLQSDISHVEVGDVNSNDDPEREPQYRGDALTINVQFKRFYYEDSPDTIDDVDHSVDADNDGTTDLTYTTT